MMRVLGVDPGTLKAGIGIIESVGNRYQAVHHEVVKMSSKESLSLRLHKLYTAVHTVIDLYKPQVLSLENVFYARDIRATVKIGEARAMAMLAAAQFNIEVVEYAPARVKQAVTGNGRASKEQMQTMIKSLFNLKVAPKEDSADALAVALCHLHAKPANQRLTKATLKAR